MDFCGRQRRILWPGAPVALGSSLFRPPAFAFALRVRDIGRGDDHKDYAQKG